MCRLDEKRTKLNESTVEKNDATRLKIFRRFLKLTQKDTAQILDISLNSYRHYENGVSTIPSHIRRRLGRLSKIDVQPLDPREDPRRVVEELLNAKPSDLAPQLLIKIHKRKEASFHLPTEVVAMEETRTNQQPTTKTFEFCVHDHQVFERITRERERVNYVRQNIFSRTRNVVNAIRDFVLLVALIYIAMKGLSIKLGFPFGAPADKPDFILVTSFLTVLSLAWAAFQDLMFDPKGRTLPKE